MRQFQLSGGGHPIRDFGAKPLAVQTAATNNVGANRIAVSQRLRTNRAGVAYGLPFGGRGGAPATLGRK
jgi:hypothetical protein